MKDPKLTSCSFSFYIEEELYIVMISPETREYTIYHNTTNNVHTIGGFSRKVFFTADFAKQLLISNL